MENLTPVTLVVKAPNQKIADQTIECALNWTVKKLKEHLASVYPSKPTETQQRIIYSGQLLQDHLMLKDVLRQYEPNQSTHTVHLVCSSSSADASQLPQQAISQPAGTADNINSTTEELRRRQPFASTGSVEQPPVSTVLPPTYGVVNAGAVQPGQFAYPFMQPAMAAVAPGNFMMNPYNADQMMWLQQTYAQYMAQYMQYYQQAGYPPQVVQPTVSADLPANQNAAVGQQRAEPAANARRRQPEVVRMNAQGGPVLNDDDDDELLQNRDWLDWVYVMIRFGILLCILYFYSTFSRFMATMGLVVLVYLYQAGWFRVNRRNHQRPQPADVVQPEQPQQQQADSTDQQHSEEEEAEEEEERNVEDGDELQPDAAVPPQGPGVLSVAWTFVISFFASLAPQQPPPVNAN